jgi:hypothetical protein
MEPGGKRSSSSRAAGFRHGGAIGRQEFLRAAARGLLVVLPLILPFEAPLFHAGPLLVTTAELALYMVLAAWGAAVALALASGERPWRLALASPLAKAAALWLAVLLVCAVVASSHRAAVLKFALRSLGGGLLFFAARDLLRAPGLARRVSLAVVAGAVISALAALLDSALPGAESLWRPFRTGGFTALGLPRASGAFAYPTIAAMYWEAAVPLLVATLFGNGRALDRARPWVGGAVATALAGVLIGAMLLSATRTALVGATLASAAMVVLCRRAGDPRLRLAAGGALGLTLVLVALTLLPGRADSLLSQRLHWWRDGSWFKASFTVSPGPLTMKAGKTVGVPITVRNEGTLIWLRGGSNPVHLSYHWERDDASGPRLDFDGRRTLLPAAVSPGETVSLLGGVKAPRTPGHYRLRWDMVCELVTWFSQRGNPTADQTVDVVPADPRQRRSGSDDDMLASSLEDWVTPATPSRPDLWRAAVRLWLRNPLLGVGPDNFRRLYPEVIAPARGGRRFEDDRLHANNFYLETLADLGVVGLAALCLLAATLVARGRAQAAAGRWLPLAAAVAVGTFFVHGVLDYFLEFTPSYGLFWLLLALADPPMASAGSRDSTPSAPAP